MTWSGLSTESGMHQKKVNYFLCILGGLLLAQFLILGSISANEDLQHAQKLIGQCKTCHGADGIARIPIAPNIAGESSTYLANQLHAFKSGQREHEMMNVVAKSLNKNTIDLLSKWYSNIKISAQETTQVPDPILSKCSQCHGTNGIAVTESTPHLAGESIIYIDTQLKAFRSGKRNHEIMSAIATDLTDEEIREIAEWYSNITLNIVE